MTPLLSIGAFHLWFLRAVPEPGRAPFHPPALNLNWHKRGESLEREGLNWSLKTNPPGGITPHAGLHRLFQKRLPHHFQGLL
jgi:hypothetical protein